jgi:hypothetical protein
MTTQEAEARLDAAAAANDLRAAFYAAADLFDTTLLELYG